MLFLISIRRRNERQTRRQIGGWVRSRTRVDVDSVGLDGWLGGRNTGKCSGFHRFSFTSPVRLGFVEEER